MRSWVLVGLMMLPILGLCADSTRFDESVGLLSAGKFRRAEEGLRECLQSKPEPMEEAVIRKWLAQALAAQGREKQIEAEDHLKLAGELLAAMDTNQVPAVKAERGRVLLVTAQLFHLDAVRRLRQLRLTGAEEALFFELLQTRVSPADSALSEAKTLYPPDLLADVFLAEADLANLKLNLKEIFFPDSDLTGSYRQVCAGYQAAIDAEVQRGPELRADVAASAWMGLGTAFREEAARLKGAERKERLAQADAAFSKAIETKTAQRELMAVAVIGKARSLLAVYEEESLPESCAAGLEALLLSAADAYEEMRADQAGVSALQNAASFFSSRTAIYETLLLFYEKTKEPEKMFLSAERMKARTFRELLNSGAVSAKAGDSALDIQQQAGELKRQNAGLVEFFYGPDRVWSFWVSPSGNVEVRKLSMTGQELTRKIATIQKGFSDSRVLRRHLRSMTESGIANSAMAGAYAAAHELYSELLEPVEQQMRADGLDLLYIVPHHAMHYLPFQALVVQQNDSDLLQSTYYAETGRALAYLPSAATLPKPTGEVFAGKARIFARSDFAGQFPVYPSNLPGAVREATSAAAVFCVTPFLEGAATEERLRSVREPCSVLYFATHGDLKADRPLDSSLLLAATAGFTNSCGDGFLTVREILDELSGKLPTELVIMSACFTNRGEPNPLSGDELSTLSRAFLIAGARSVLATQWAASDDTFPVIMSFFLKELAVSEKPQGKAHALNTAVRMFLKQENNSGSYRHPLFWAPVVLLGDGYSGIVLKALPEENF